MSYSIEKLDKDICDYIYENEGDILSEIVDKYESEEFPEGHGQFAPDGILDIVDIREDEDHFCMVEAECTISREEVITVSNDPHGVLDIIEDKCTFFFFIDKDDNGGYSYDYLRDDNGEIDLKATIMYPED